MKRLALIAVALLFAASGAQANAFASVSVGDSPAWRPNVVVEVAARSDGRGGRNDSSRGRDVHRDRHGGKVIWRHRGKHHQPFSLFRSRGDCKTLAVEVPDDTGKLVVRHRWVCN